MSTLFHRPPAPELRPLDDGFQAIKFQFQPLSLAKNLGGVWSSVSGLNREHPILQFSHGDQQSFTFDARLFAKHQLDSVEDVLRELERSTQRDPQLKRPPRWEFIWGSVIHETVIVESVGNIRYDDIRVDGSVRGVLLSITLQVYRGADVELTQPGAPRPSTFYVHTRTDDQWEDLAEREYGDALLGDLLRRRHPDLPFPGQVPGTIVALPPLETLRDEVVEPTAPPLQRTPDGLKLRRELFEKRGQGRESPHLIG